MTATAPSGTPDLDRAIVELEALRRSMLDGQACADLWIREAAPDRTASAINLARYLAMRRTDLRVLQTRLATLGVSSLGRAETHALDNVDTVLGVLHRMRGSQAELPAAEESIDTAQGEQALHANADRLFGPARPERHVRIMVTLPGEAANDRALVERLVSAGMDVARINCAHDDADAWRRMAEHVRQAAAAAERPVKVLMDLAGPKVRTGPIEDGPPVLKVKPRKDSYGQVLEPARLGLRPAGSDVPVPDVDDCIGVDEAFLDRLVVGDELGLVDARFSKRTMHVVEREDNHVVVECRRTSYLTAATVLQLRRKHGKRRESAISDLPVVPQVLRLRRGDTLRLTAHGIGHADLLASREQPAREASVACTLPEVLMQVREGHRVYFDDGRIGGRVRKQSAEELEIEITQALDEGTKLGADKGINLPDTPLDIPSLTSKDLADLETVAGVADLVGMSFAQTADDVRALRRRLDALGATDLAMILKIETRRGFENLPQMLFASMAGPGSGVMIARGDLAVECGFERIAEVQEEVMWACEAAHVPVVWATQVLESLAKTGLPSRAEVTDAAMGGRTECVMLNKGPHIEDAIRTLADILRRMQGHQSKKRTLLRALSAWNEPQPGG